MYLAKCDDFRKTLHNKLVAKVITIDDKVVIEGLVFRKQQDLDKQNI